MNYKHQLISQLLWQQLERESYLVVVFLNLASLASVCLCTGTMIGMILGRE
jgi:hypothetical protein